MRSRFYEIFFPASRKRKELKRNKKEKIKEIAIITATKYAILKQDGRSGIKKSSELLDLRGILTKKCGIIDEKANKAEEYQRILFNALHQLSFVALYKLWLWRINQRSPLNEFP